MTQLSIGGVVFEGFEVPSAVAFGGEQALVVHKMPGGGRIVDVMGRDDYNLVWSGILTGVEASSRARQLDAIRVAGNIIPVSWNAFYYSAIIASLKLTYDNSWWIRYELTCKVVSDEAQSTALIVSSDSTAILTDIEIAATFTDLGSASSLVSAQSALSAGTQANATATLALTQVASNIDQKIYAAEQQLQAPDIATLVIASGSLADLTLARGYIGRASTNLQYASQ
jgi:hypothetical protein